MDHPASNTPGDFVSERLQPEGDEFALAAAIGEPALPLRFKWRRQTHEITAVLRRWKEYDADRSHGSGERYLRRHWFEVRLADGTRWTLYFLRQPGSRRSAKSRWWLYEVHIEPAGRATPSPDDIVDHSPSAPSAIRSELPESRRAPTCGP